MFISIVLQLAVSGDLVSVFMNWTYEKPVHQNLHLNASKDRNKRAIEARRCPFKKFPLFIPQKYKPGCWHTPHFSSYKRNRPTKFLSMEVSSVMCVSLILCFYPFGNQKLSFSNLSLSKTNSSSESSCYQFNPHNHYILNEVYYAIIQHLISFHV